MQCNLIFLLSGEKRYWVLSVRISQNLTHWVIQWVYSYWLFLCTVILPHYWETEKALKMQTFSLSFESCKKVFLPSFAFSDTLQFIVFYHDWCFIVIGILNHYFFFFLLQFNLLNVIMTSFKCFLFLMENNNGTEKVTEKKFSQCFLSMAHYKLETTACKWYTLGGSFYCNEDCKKNPLCLLGEFFSWKSQVFFSSAVSTRLYTNLIWLLRAEEAVCHCCSVN